jgi:hypothetical protein
MIFNNKGGTCAMLSNDQNVQVSDTTAADSSNAAGLKFEFFL